MSARFCADCGAPLAAPRHALARRTCSACARVQFDNPEIFTGVIVHTQALEALYLTPLGHREKLQSAALRALGNPVIPEARLALYCALTDLDAGAVCLLFRIMPPAADQGGYPTEAAVAPCAAAWVAELLRRHAGDRARGRFPVYAARYRAGALSLDEVPCEDRAR